MTDDDPTMAQVWGDIWRRYETGFMATIAMVVCCALLALMGWNCSRQQSQWKTRHERECANLATIADMTEPAYVGGRCYAKRGGVAYRFDWSGTAVPVVKP